VAGTRAFDLRYAAVGSLVFRRIARFTRGKFIFVEYDRDEVAHRAGEPGEVGLGWTPARKNRC